MEVSRCVRGADTKGHPAVVPWGPRVQNRQLVAIRSRFLVAGAGWGEAGLAVATSHSALSVFRLYGFKVIGMPGKDLETWQ